MYIRIRMYVCIQVRIHIHTCTYVYIVYVMCCTSICMCIWLCIQAHMCIHTYIYICIYIYINTQNYMRLHTSCCHQAGKQICQSVRPIDAMESSVARKSAVVRHTDSTSWTGSTKKGHTCVLVLGADFSIQMQVDPWWPRSSHVVRDRPRLSDIVPHRSSSHEKRIKSIRCYLLCYLR